MPGLGRPSSPWIPIVGGVALVAIGAALAIAWPRLSGSTGGTASGSGSPGAVSSPLASGGSVAPAPAAPDRPHDDTAWWRTHTEPFGATVIQVVDIGTLGAGIVTSVPLAMQDVGMEPVVFPIRVVIGPRAGRVVTIGADGLEAVITAIDAVSGDEVELARTSDVVIDAGFAGSGSVVFLTGDRRTGELTGLWTVDVTGAAPPEPVDGVLGATDIRLAARSVAVVRLMTSPTGDTAAVLHCGIDQVCVLRAVSLVDGTRYAQRLGPAEEPIGLAGTHVFIRPVCMAGECPGLLLDLATGDRAPQPQLAPGAFFQEAVIASAAGPLLITQVSGSVMPKDGVAEAPSFIATALETGASAAPVVVELGTMRILTHFDAGVDLPDGWFGVLGTPVGEAARVNVPLEAFAIEASTGRVVPLPALGDFFFQG